MDEGDGSQGRRHRPFDHLVTELKNLNALWTGAFGAALFKHTDPEELGWLLRPSQREWDELIVQLGKVLYGLDAAGASREVKRDNKTGQHLGTLTRLADFLKGSGIDAPMVKVLMQPLREFRQARQRPDHAFTHQRHR